jgi:hypothetical protein
MALKRTARMRMRAAAAAAVHAPAPAPALAPAPDPAPAPALPTVDLGMVRREIAELDMETAMADLREAEESWYEIRRQHDPPRHGPIAEWQPARDRMRIRMLLQRRVDRG